MQCCQDQSAGELAVWRRPAFLRRRRLLQPRGAGLGPPCGRGSAHSSPGAGSSRCRRLACRPATWHYSARLQRRWRCHQARRGSGRREHSTAACLASAASGQQRPAAAVTPAPARRAVAAVAGGDGLWVAAAARMPAAAARQRRAGDPCAEAPAFPGAVCLTPARWLLTELHPHAMHVPPCHGIRCRPFLTPRCIHRHKLSRQSRQASPSWPAR